MSTTPAFTLYVSGDDGDNAFFEIHSGSSRNEHYEIQNAKIHGVGGANQVKIMYKTKGRAI